VFYLTAIVSVFKIFFVVHLCLRFIWAGLLGLSYAFPEGAINERLFKVGQSYNYQKPSDMVLKLEKICSMTFAYPISLVITFLAFTVYLGFLITIYVWFDLNFFVIYLIFMGSIFLFGGFMMINSKSKFKTWYSQSIVSSIAAIYQSHLGKWFALFYGIFIFILATPIILSDVQNFSLFQNERRLSEAEMEWPLDEQHYMEGHDPAKRYARGFIPSEEINDNYLRIGVARYEKDVQVVEDLHLNFRKTLDSLNWQNIQSPADLHRIYINDSLYQVDAWSKNRIAVSRQKAFHTGIDIGHLKNGVHEIRIEKLLVVYGFLDNKPEVRLRNDWSIFTFVKK
jgi:hypothetical protein